MVIPSSRTPIPEDYADRIRRLRGRLGLTQQALAEQLGIAFATVNRWENGQSKPSRLYWTHIEKLGVGESSARLSRSLLR